MHARTHALALIPHLGTHPGPLLPGSRQIRLAVPGAYEKPQLLPLQPPLEADSPATFTFHVNPVLHSKLDVELGEKLMVLQVSEPRAWKRWMIDSVLPEQCSGASVQADFLHSRGFIVFSSLQSDPSAELEAQSSKLGEGGILLSSLALGQEEQHLVALGEVRLCLGASGTPACFVTTKTDLGEGSERVVKIRPARSSAMVHIWARVTRAAGAAGGRTLPRALRGGCCLSGPGGNSECEGRNEVRKARFKRKALRLGWKRGGSPTYSAYLGVGRTGRFWFWWDLSEGFHRVWVCSCQKWAWPEALLH